MSNQLAESKLLACLMQDNDLIYECDISPEYFGNSDHAKIFAKIVELHRDKKVIDSVTLSWPDIEIALVQDIELSHFGTSWFQDYLQIIKDSHIYDKLIQLSQEVTAMCRWEKPLDMIQAKITKQLDAYTWTDKPVKFLQSIVDVVEWIGNDDSIICRYGYPSLDTIAGGISRGQLIIVGARPKVGKTSMMLWIAENTARQWIKTICYSLEMKQKEIAKRYIAKLAWATVRQLELNKEQAFKDRIVERVNSIPSWMDNITVVDNLYTPELIIRSITREAKKNWAEVVLIDYLGLIKPFAWDNQLKTYQIQEITTSLKRTANTLWIWIILFCQINRVADKEDREPKPSDLKDSWSIEQDADTVLLLHRELDYRDVRNQEMEVIVALQRKWPMGRCKLRYNKPTMSLRDDRATHQDNPNKK